MRIGEWDVDTKDISFYKYCGLEEYPKSWTKGWNQTVKVNGKEVTLVKGKFYILKRVSIFILWQKIVSCELVSDVLINAEKHLLIMGLRSGKDRSYYDTPDKLKDFVSKIRESWEDDSYLPTVNSVDTDQG